MSSYCFISSSVFVVSILDYGHSNGYVTVSFFFFFFFLDKEAESQGGKMLGTQFLSHKLEKLEFSHWC